MTQATRKGFLLRLDPALVARVDAARGAVSRNRYLEALIQREMDTIEGVRPASAIAEVGEPAPLAPTEFIPVGPERAESAPEPDLLTEDLVNDDGHPVEDAMDEWWR